MDMDNIENKKEKNSELRLNRSISIPQNIVNRLKKFIEHDDCDGEDERVCTEFAKHYHNFLNITFDQFLEDSKTVFKNPLRHVDLEECNDSLTLTLLENDQCPDFVEIFDKRKKLPVMKYQNEILTAIEENQVVLIVGSTGCGKTTQVPQILLDGCIRKGLGAECRIVCTQPRRISAVLLAERVAEERNEPLCESVGYKIRLETRAPRSYASILFCTTGVLLQTMQSNPLLLGMSYIILDEIHERSVDTDILMALIKMILPHRPDLKVILMSATVSEETFCEYFDNCFTLRVEGKMFPVEVLYLEDILEKTHFNMFNDRISKGARQLREQTNKSSSSRNPSQYNIMMANYLPILREKKYSDDVINTLINYMDCEGCANLDFIEHLIYYICEGQPPGSILVFLPGIEKISSLANKLKNPFNIKHKILAQKNRVYTLYSKMPTFSQKSIFQPVPKDMRKIILSTTLAETSVTIEDVVYIINSGKIKYKEYDVDKDIETFDQHWTSKANTKQRQGRAGRVQPGVCYNLFTRAREELMLEVPIPEILRVKLTSILLNLKVLHINDPFNFVKNLISVPHEEAVRNGLALLKRIEALDSNENVTPLGVHLARMPADPQMGKMILMSALFSCVDPITSAAAGLSYRNPFYIPLGKDHKVRSIKQKLSKGSRSDHLLTHNVIKKYRDAKADDTVSEFCYDNFLSCITLSQLESLKRLFTDVLHRSKFLQTSDCLAESSNLNSDNLNLLKAIIAAGLYPNIAFLKNTKRTGNKCQPKHIMSTPEHSVAFFHRASINNDHHSFDSKYFVYLQKQRSQGVQLLESTMVPPMALLIFGDGVEQGESGRNLYIGVANKYFFKCDKHTSTFILLLREKLGILLKKKALYPSPIKPQSKEAKLLKVIEIMLSWNGDMDSAEVNFLLSEVASSSTSEDDYDDSDGDSEDNDED